LLRIEMLCLEKTHPCKWRSLFILCYSYTLNYIIRFAFESWNSFSV
jgi:hypothetical protein